MFALHTHSLHKRYYFASNQWFAGTFVIYSNVD